MVEFRRPIPRILASVAVVPLLILAAGCTTTRSPGPTASIAPTSRSEAEWRREADAAGARYRANSRDSAAAIQYAQALRATGQRSQAVSVLEQASMQDPNNPALLGAYGRALADTGKLEQAFEVFGRAHSPDRPDWRILSAQGAVLDQLGRHEEAQRYYSAALKIVPDEPTVLSNLGLSYALAKDLPNAEATLRRAAAQGVTDQRVRQNLALVIGLQGRFAEAEDIARADLPQQEAAANVTYLRQMMAQQDDWKALRQPGRKQKTASTRAAEAK